MNPFFSIIIPTFNCAKTIKIALESILEQTFKDFEILIMDGNSTDNTLEIIKSYNDERIKFFSEPDRGIYDAMNKGIKHSLGKWLFFLGSDDKVYPEVLSHIERNVINTDIDIIYGDVYSTRFDGIYDGEFKWEDIIKKNICHQSIFFNKNVFKKIGKFNLKFKAHADWEHNLKWYFHPMLKHIYTPVIIADYADGGYSSTFNDPIFRNKKIKYIFKYGWRSLPNSYSEAICMQYIYSKEMAIYYKFFFMKYYILIKYFKKLS